MSVHLPPIGRLYSVRGKYVLAAAFYTERHLGALLETHRKRHPSPTVIRFKSQVRRPK